MGLSSLLCEAHLLKPGLSLVWSLMGQSPSFAVRGSFARAWPLSGPESHGSVSFAARRSLARAGPLSGLESHGSVSFAVQGSFAPAWPLSDAESHG